jgi:hypothetical protein
VACSKVDWLWLRRAHGRDVSLIHDGTDRPTGLTLERLRSLANRLRRANCRDESFIEKLAPELASLRHVLYAELLAELVADAAAQAGRP